MNNFKPQPTKISSLSQNITLAPPDLNIPYDATNTATIIINGNSNPNLFVEIFVNNSLASTTEADQNGNFTSDPISLQSGDNQIYGKTKDSSNHESLASKEIDITFNNTPPQLTITEPQDGQVVTSSDQTVVVSGQTNSDGNTTVTINGYRAIIDDNGNFSESIPITNGDNTITIIATDNSGNVTQITKKVTYQGSSPTPSISPSEQPTPTPSS